MILLASYQLLPAATAEVATAPWWGVPVIAGCFLIVGASFAFLSTLASDKRKAKRDKAERIMIDTRTVGLEYLDAANAFTNLIRAQQDPSREKHGTDFLAAVAGSLIHSQEVRGKFELFAHDDALAAAKRIDGACILLLVDVVSDWDVATNLAEYESSKLALVNVLRKASGVGEIDAQLPDPKTKKKLDADMASVLGHIEESMIKKYVDPQNQEEERPV